MKKVYFILFLLFISAESFAQFGTSFHQSNLPFIGFNYEVKHRFVPELRIGTDNFFENTSLEIALNYIFKKDELVNLYAGLGVRIQLFDGLVVPLGMNIYPFEKKNFGFQMELAGLMGEESLLRGSWGIRYRFNKE